MPQVQHIGSETAPASTIIAWLERHGVDYEIHAHTEAFTAADAAHAEGVQPATFAKVVGVRTSDGRNALAVLDATDQVDLGELAEVIGVEWVALLGEAGLAALVPEFEVGTTPPIPDLVRVPMYVDEAVRVDPEISFAAGSHRHSVRVDRAAWERATGVEYAKFAVRRRSIRSLAERGWT